MRVALLAPLKRELSKDTKGGRPRIVYNLSEGLVKRGHDVTVFGTGDSTISAKLIPAAPKALYHLPQVENDFYRHLIYLCEMMRKLLEHPDDFDIIHNHLYPEMLPLLFSNELRAPIVSTIHTQMTSELGEFFAKYPNTYFSPISNRQKALFPGLNYTDTVYNGIDESEFAFSQFPGSYLLFVGRIRDFFTDEKGDKIDPKGVTDAIRVAKASGEALKIVGNVESQSFFQREIAPHLSSQISYIGDPKSIEGTLSLAERVSLYQGAKALLLPIHWEEPFGIVMIEALSCGTPVIAYNKGAVSEVITNGETGFVVENESQMLEAVRKISTLDRQAARNAVERRFCTSVMVDNYVTVYSKILTKRSLVKV